jgi:hypothetical protein
MPIFHVSAGVGWVWVVVADLYGGVYTYAFMHKCTYIYAFMPT